MPLFSRKPKPAPPIPTDLPPGEEVQRSVRATLIQGKSSAIKGGLYMTNRRLMFYAERGDARWLTVPFDEIASVNLYPAPGATMGAPGSRSQCLHVETTKGEQVWWDFGSEEERTWLPLVQERVTAHTDATDD